MTIIFRAATDVSMFENANVGEREVSEIDHCVDCEDKSTAYIRRRWASVADASDNESFA